MTSTEMSAAQVITPAQLLRHWQGHRDLTRRVIDAFPEDKLFTFSIGGMRPFGELAKEFLRMSVPMVEGIAMAKWDTTDRTANAKTKADLLAMWDQDTARINDVWPTIRPERFQDVDKAFGQWDGVVYSLLWYVIDNEIHHRGQGYVYLRALGIDPPAFYDRQ
jgi:uncharacterized damage-inducible protein DinB